MSNETPVQTTKPTNYRGQCNTRVRDVLLELAEADMVTFREVVDSLRKNGNKRILFASNNPINGCWLHDKVTCHEPKRGWYAQLRTDVQHIVDKLGGKKLSIMLHVFAHFIYKKSADEVVQLLKTIKGDHHVSHLCHHSGCVNPQHLEYEPAQVNLDRINCKGTVMTALPSFVLAQQVCQHNPPCRKVTMLPMSTMRILPQDEIPLAMYGQPEVAAMLAGGGAASVAPLPDRRRPRVELEEDEEWY